VQQDVDAPAPRVGVGLGDGTDGADDTGVVEHHVQTPPRVDGQLDRGDDRGLVGDVTLDEASGVPQLARDHLSQVGLDVGHDHVGALLHEPPGAGGADPAGRTGDDGGLALQTVAHAQSLIIAAIVSW
jgi:hypothetical protein